MKINENKPRSKKMKKRKKTKMTINENKPRSKKTKKKLWM